MKKFTRILALTLFSLVMSSLSIGQVVEKEKASEPSEKLRVEQETALRMEKKQQQTHSATADTEEGALQQEALVQQTVIKTNIAEDGQNIFVEQNTDESLKNEIELSPMHYNLLTEHGLIRDGVLTFESVEQLENLLGVDLVKEFTREN
jgi:hypothetical protein